MGKHTWSKRRRAYVFGVSNFKWNLTRTMIVFLCIVCEKTLGFSKTKDEISLSQFQEYMGGISEKHVSRLRKELARLGFIHYIPGRWREDIPQYSIEEDQAKWTVRPGQGTWRKGDMYMSSFNEQKRDIKGDILGQKGGHKSNERRTQNGIKADIHTPLTEETEDTEGTGETQKHANSPLRP